MTYFHICPSSQQILATPLDIDKSHDSDYLVDDVRKSEREEAVAETVGCEAVSLDRGPFGIDVINHGGPVFSHRRNDKLIPVLDQKIFDIIHLPIPTFVHRQDLTVVMDYL